MQNDQNVIHILISCFAKMLNFRPNFEITKKKIVACSGCERVLMAYKCLCRPLLALKQGLWSRQSQSVSNFRKTATKKGKRKFIYVRILQPCAITKLYKIESQFFAARSRPFRVGSSCNSKSKNIGM